MTEQIKEFANRLDGRCEGSEITKAEAQIAKARNLVVVFAYSDDNMEFLGAIDDEVECYDGGFAYLDKNGLIENDCDSEYCPHYKRAIEAAYTIEAVWNPATPQALTWNYKTDIPHQPFMIYYESDEGEQFCEGIVFSLDNLG